MRRRTDPEAEARKKRRDAGAALWRHAIDEPTRQRSAMVVASFFLDEAHEYELADWLLCARPHFAVIVATGVAVHGLIRGVTQAWDALAAAKAMDLDQAEVWLATETGEFVWSPEPGWLMEKTEGQPTTEIGQP